MKELDVVEAYGNDPEVKQKSKDQSKDPSDEVVRKSTGQLVKKRKVPRLIMNLIYTFYPVVKKVSKQLNYRCKCEDI